MKRILGNSVKKIFVTGGAGFIGSNVVDGIIEAGHQVLVVDNLYTGKRSNVNPEARFYELDIRARETAELIKEKDLILSIIMPPRSACLPLYQTLFLTRILISKACSICWRPPENMR